MMRRCVGTPPPGYLVCPNPATHWQVRQWGQGTMNGLYPVHLDLCKACHYHSAERSDVLRHGAH